MTQSREWLRRKFLTLWMVAGNERSEPTANSTLRPTASVWASHIRRKCPSVNALRRDFQSLPPGNHLASVRNVLGADGQRTRLTGDAIQVDFVVFPLLRRLVLANFLRPQRLPRELHAEL